MVGYIVAKSHAHINGKVFSRGEKVELDDTLALHLLDQGVVISSSDSKVSTEADGLFAELQKKVTDLEKTIEQQKGMIANFAAELELKNKMIAEYDTQPKRRRA